MGQTHTHTHTHTHTQWALRKYSTDHTDLEPVYVPAPAEVCEPLKAVRGV